jgi:hypothetical protein
MCWCWFKITSRRRSRGREETPNVSHCPQNEFGSTADKLRAQCAVPSRWRGTWSHPGGGYAHPKSALAPVATWLRYVTILGPKSGPCSQKWLRLRSHLATPWPYQKHWITVAHTVKHVQGVAAVWLPALLGQVSGYHVL